MPARRQPLAQRDHGRVRVAGLERLRIHLWPATLRQLASHVGQRLLQRDVLRMLRLHLFDEAVGVAIERGVQLGGEIRLRAARFPLRVDDARRGPSDRDVAAHREQGGGQAHVELGEPLMNVRRIALELLDVVVDLRDLGLAVIGGVEGVIGRGMKDLDRVGGLLRRLLVVDPRGLAVALCVELAYICPDDRLNRGRPGACQHGRQRGRDLMRTGG